MNKHLPPDTVKELGTIPAGTIGARPVETFIVVRGTRRGREPYLEDTMMDRAHVIAHVSEDIDFLKQIIAFDLSRGTSRDATKEIVSIIIDRWGQDDMALSESQRNFVAEHRGEAFANAFRMELV